MRGTHKSKAQSGRRQDICAPLETAYLRINLFLLIINLDYSRHLKKGQRHYNKDSKAAGGKKRVHSTGRLDHNRSEICLEPTVVTWEGSSRH